MHIKHYIIKLYQINPIDEIWLILIDTLIVKETIFSSELVIRLSVHSLNLSYFIIFKSLKYFFFGRFFRTSISYL